VTWQKRRIRQAKSKIYCFPQGFLFGAENREVTKEEVVLPR